VRISSTAGRLLIGLGLFLSLAAAASGLAEARPDASPFDQAGDSAPLGHGFDPMPAGAAGEPGVAPTLYPQTGGQTGDFRTILPTGVTAPRPTVAPPDSAARVEPRPTATAVPLWIPDRIVIPAIELDAPVVPSALVEVATWGKLYQQWVAPDLFASGWHTTSAPLGVAGNTVLNGHHNIRGEVFGRLVDLVAGDLIWAYSGDQGFVYRIAMVTILPERWQPMDVRVANAQWIQPSRDERLTLVTCWPSTSNTHRLVIVATPLEADLTPE
jgi:LPXTG-site transpeptidase (sortase) family protein